MFLTSRRKNERNQSWLFFMFQLSARRASKRVNVWRKLQKYGALNWDNCAYVLPLDSSGLEKFQWLATEIRKYGGEASVIEVPRIHGCNHSQIVARFNKARASQFATLIRDARLTLRGAASRSKPQQLLDFSRLNRRLGDLKAIDFFGCGKSEEAEGLVNELQSRARGRETRGGGEPKEIGEYRGRTWQTRPRPEVDRVGSAWLIQHFIDPKARFIFSADPEAYPDAVRFDMFGGEFTHEGDDCTFETLLKRFRLRDKRLDQIAQIIHDGDLEDNKFGRAKGKALELITKGWAKMDCSDEEILRKGFELFDALYLTVGT
jgi:hypothetical protein